MAERVAEQEAADAGPLAEVAERRSAETALAAGEERFRALVQQSSDIIVIVDPSAVVTYESPSASRVLGYGPNALVGTSPLGLVHPDDLPCVLAAFEQTRNKQNPGTPTEFRFKRADGTWIHVEALGNNLVDNPAVGGIVLTCREISERKRAEDEIRRKLEELTVLNTVATIAVEATDEEWLAARATQVVRDSLFPDNCGILLVDEKNGVLRHAQSYHCRTPTEEATTIALGEGVTGRVAVTGVAMRVPDVFAEPCYLAVDPETRSEICVPLKVGQQVIGVIDAESREAAAFEEGDERLLATVAGQVATAIGRLRAASAVREREERFRRLADAAFEGIVVIHEGRILDANRRFAEMLGYQTSEILGRPVSEFVAPESRDIVLAHVHAGAEDAYVHMALRKDGSVFPVEAQGKALPWDGQRRRVTALRDITERRRAEGQIRLQLERLAALRAIDSAITSSLDVKVTLKVFLGHVREQLHVDAAAVLLLHVETGTLEYAAGEGFRSRALQHTRLSVGESFAGQAALDRRIVHVDDLSAEPSAFSHSPLLMSEGFRAYYAVPFVAKGRVKGVLEIFHRAALAADEEWLEFLKTLAGQAAIAIDNMSLFEDIQRSNVELALAYDTTLEGWSRALELRDRETQGHTLRVTDLTIRLARAVGVAEGELVQVRRGALLHDIGKMGIPDAILLKPGPLSPDEWVVMRQHAVLAYNLLSPIAFLRPAMDIPYCHHEKWDGSGYPRGLAGEVIPLPARVFAVADAWDALTHPRPYRAAWPAEKVRAHLAERAGRDFERRIVEHFLEMEL